MRPGDAPPCGNRTRGVDLAPMDQNTQPQSSGAVLRGAARLCRTVAALLISGLWRRRSLAETERTLECAPTHQQVLIVAATLGLLFAGAFVAAQAGFIGMLAYLLAVILIAR